MLKYLTTYQVINLHDEILSITGGPPGIRDIGGVASAIARPFTTYGDSEPYPTLEEKAAALAHAISRSHPFVDGNKRTAIAAGSLFLMVNGRDLTADQTDLERTAWALASGEIDLPALATWFRENSTEIEAQ